MTKPALLEDYPFRTGVPAEPWPDGSSWSDADVSDTYSAWVL